MAEDSMTKNVVKFDGSNFQLRKFQITQVFHVCDINDVVTGTRTAPEELTSAEEKKWMKDNARAMCIISS